MTTVLITGANRGIGLMLCRLYADDNALVLAVCREPDSAGALNELQSAFPDRVRIFECDVTSETDVQVLADTIGDQKIDILINNAGIMGPERQSRGDMDFDGWAETFAVNSMAPLRVSQLFLRNLALSENPRLITITSQMGQLSRQSTGSYAYRTSKTAANMVMHLLHLELKDQNIICIPCHPGWVQTDMGGPSADISVEDSAQGLKSLFDALTPEQSGRFWAWDGSELDW